MAIELPAERPAHFSSPASRWKQAVGYCLLLALTGLQFYPALIGVAVFLLWRWRSGNRYAFLVELMLFMGSYCFIPFDVLPFKPSDIALMLGLGSVCIVRKRGVTAKVLWMMLGYFAALILIARTSVESISIQFLMLRNYLGIISAFIPLVVFAGREFEWDRLISEIALYALTICGFYVVDAFLFGSYLLCPAAQAWGVTTFMSFNIQPLSIPRHYPPGLYWLLPLIVAINYRRMSLSHWQWALILLALLSSRTNSLLFALIICFGFFRPGIKQVIAFAVGAVVLLCAAYTVDKSLGSPMRLAFNIDQFASLQTAQDNEDLAEFGTGRMAQILPKWELLTDMDRNWLGFGFLHSTKTTNPVFQIQNDYYIDASRADEVATAVEVTQVQTILDCGYLGLIIQTLFFFGLYFLLRKRRPYYALNYLCVITGMEVLGIGGFSGLIMAHGNLIAGTILGAVMLTLRPEATRVA